MPRSIIAGKSSLPSYLTVPKLPRLLIPFSKKLKIVKMQTFINMSTLMSRSSKECKMKQVSFDKGDQETCAC